MIGFYFPQGKEEFEYDVRGLLMSFFPGQELCRLTSAEAGADCDYVLEINGFPEIEDRTARKNAVKQAVYDTLVQTTGQQLPWGTLTGIRPTKLAMGLWEEAGYPEDTSEIEEYLKKTYRISDEKLALSMDIIKNEKKIVSQIDYVNGYSLYIGIPFCPTTCLYCSFTSYPIGKWLKRLDEYIEALFKEMDAAAEIFQGRCPDSIYIGGGTPTSLPPEYLDRLLDKVCRTFDLSHLKEFTVEAGRPDSITREKFEVLRRYPVSRISINPQTMKEETLRKIGRQHTVEQLKSAYAMARELGFDNINMDIILGLPGENAEDVACTIEEICRMKPDSLTVHALAVKRASRLKMEAEGTVVAGLGQEESEKMMAVSTEGARSMGMEPYYLYRQKNMAGNLENVGFSEPGKAGIYNILIMEELQSIAALGAGTVSKIVRGDGTIDRCDNVKDVDQYIERIDEMIERKRTLYKGER